MAKGRKNSYEERVEIVTYCIQKVEMKDARTPKTPGVPQTGDNYWKPFLLFALLSVSVAGLIATMIYKKKHGNTDKEDETKAEE